MTEGPPAPDPIAVAMEWVTKITTVGLEMMLPAVGGGYLDRRFGTTYWTLLGLVVGVTTGIWHLLLMTRQKQNRNGSQESNGGSASE